MSYKNQKYRRNIKKVTINGCGKVTLACASINKWRAILLNFFMNIDRFYLKIC
jgi:hypothetical protein